MQRRSHIVNILKIDPDIASLSQDDIPVIFYMLFVVSGSDYYMTGSVKRHNLFLWCIVSQHLTANHTVTKRHTFFGVT